MNGLYGDLNLLPGDPKNRVNIDPLIRRGLTETPEMLQGEYSRLRGLAGTSGFGHDLVGGALGRKIADLNNERVGDIQSQFDRNLPMQFAKRMQGYQGLADAAMANEQTENLLQAQRHAQEEAKRAQMWSGVLGIAGTAGGAAVGGPVGAAIGGGAGSMLGGAIV